MSMIARWVALRILDRLIPGPDEQYLRRRLQELMDDPEKRRSLTVEEMEEITARIKLELLREDLEVLNK